MNRSLLIIALFSLSPGPVAQAQVDDGHDHGGPHVELNMSDFSPDERLRIDRLYGLVICACPKENWTKSLAGCPDGCAMTQKEQLRRGVKEGKTDEEILAMQKQLHGSKVLGRPPASGLSGFFFYWLPFVLLGVLTLAVAFILRNAIRRTPIAGGTTPATAATPIPESDREIDAEVERELRGMD